MQRVGFLLKVKDDPETIARYKEHHRNVSPEMLDALRRQGWNNYSLFMRPDGLMFGYVEVSDSFQASLDGMSHEDANSRWQAMMEPFFESPDGGRPDENMVQLEEVFHLD